jgi:hypothetical protein
MNVLRNIEFYVAFVFDMPGLQNRLFSAVSTQQKKKKRDIRRERVIVLFVCRTTEEWN